MKQLLNMAILAAISVGVLSGSTIAAETIEIPFSLGKGQMLYEQYCSSCHGLQLEGSDKGPPLVHPFYKPSHHGDKAFYRAALHGTKQHHWNFGDMPQVEGITSRELDKLVPYVRYYQQQKKLY